MATMICGKCMEAYLEAVESRCPGCGDERYDFSNDDTFLTDAAARVAEERRACGLEGLAGGLAAVIVNCEPAHRDAAAGEFIRRTGYRFHDAFRDDSGHTVVLRLPGSADILVRSRRGLSPFESGAAYSRTRGLPATRLETFVFESPDLDRYLRIQRDRGVRFMTSEPVQGLNHRFLQTIPSTFTGSSIGLIERVRAPGCYRSPGARDYEPNLGPPPEPFTGNVGFLDHAATRMEARHRDPAIIEFLNLTGYRFDFSIYVRMFNSITNVARLSAGEFAMVFTSGIRPYRNGKGAGPTETFVHNYGQRVHHLAFATERIEDTFDALKRSGMRFLLELVGSPDEGLKQTFSEPSPHTLLVTEYIHRYGEFDGFFTASNVTKLTAATGRQ